MDRTTSADPRRPSVIRRVLTWWFSAPATPWVTANFAVDATAARAYLDRLRGLEPDARVTLQHLLCGAVGRTLADFPMARARIAGHRVLHDERVGVAMPVNLLGHAAGRSRELGMVLVEDADRRPLLELAQHTRRTVEREREDRPDNPLFKTLLRIAERADGPVLHAALDAFEAARQRPSIERRVRAMAPMTTAVTNPGAALADRPGVLFRGGAVQIPLRLAHVATLWGITPIQDEVVPVDGQPAVRPMLPVMLVFDHRLMDGVYAGRVLTRFCDILANPEATFGPRGQRVG